MGQHHQGEPIGRFVAAIEDARQGHSLELGFCVLVVVQDESALGFSERDVFHAEHLDLRVPDGAGAFDGPGRSVDEGSAGLSPADGAEALV